MHVQHGGQLLRSGVSVSVVFHVYWDSLSLSLKLTDPNSRTQFWMFLTGFDTFPFLLAISDSLTINVPKGCLFISFLHTRSTISRDSTSSLSSWIYICPQYLAQNLHLFSNRPHSRSTLLANRDISAKLSSSLHPPLENKIFLIWIICAMVRPLPPDRSPGIALVWPAGHQLVISLY